MPETGYQELLQEFLDAPQGRRTALLEQLILSFPDPQIFDDLFQIFACFDPDSIAFIQIRLDSVRRDLAHQIFQTQLELETRIPDRATIFETLNQTRDEVAQVALLQIISARIENDDLPFLCDFYKSISSIWVRCRFLNLLLPHLPVPWLLEQLHQASKREQATLLEACSTHLSIPEIQTFLNSDDLRTRINALKALSIRGQNVNAEVSACLHHPSVLVQAGGAWLLRFIDINQAEELYQGLRLNKEPVVREHLIRALELQAEQGKGLAALMLRSLAPHHQFFQSLKKILDQPAFTLLTSKNSLELTLALSEIHLSGRNGDILRKTLGFLSSKTDPGIATQALRYLRQCYPEFLPKIAIRLLQHNNARVRSDALQALEPGAIKDWESLGLLIKDKPTPRTFVSSLLQARDLLAAQEIEELILEKLYLRKEEFLPALFYLLNDKETFPKPNLMPLFLSCSTPDIAWKAWQVIQQNKIENIRFLELWANQLEHIQSLSPLLNFDSAEQLSLDLMKLLHRILSVFDHSSPVADFASLASRMEQSTFLTCRQYLPYIYRLRECWQQSEVLGGEPGSDLYFLLYQFYPLLQHIGYQERILVFRYDPFNPKETPQPV